MLEETPALLNQDGRGQSKLRYEPQLIQTPFAWQPLLSEPLRTRALDAVSFVAERMRNPDFVHAIAEQMTQQFSERIRWFPSFLYCGDMSIAFMYGYIDQCFPGHGGADLAHQYLSLAAASTQHSGVLLPGLFAGTTGMALVFSMLSQGGQRYQKTLASLHQGLCQQIEQKAWRRSGADEGIATQDYDVVSGAAGVLAYLVSIQHPDEQIRAAIERLLEYLIWLGEPDQPVGKERWYTSSKFLVTEEPGTKSSQGHFNCGLAHGIPGPLAALALAWQTGYRYPGLREAITYLADWIVEHRVGVSWGLDWPAFIPREYASRPEDWRQLPPGNPTWCYGAPGVARSLWLAGQALEDEQLRLLAIETIETTLRRPLTRQMIPSLHLCHGVASVLQICLRFAHECESQLIRQTIPTFVEWLLDAFEPTCALGFRSLDLGVVHDEPGWLTGASGIAMALLAASSSVIPAWDRALVIA